MATLSLCICTMNRPLELETALRSIFDGSSIPLQVIVSDDGDGTARETCSKFPSVIYTQGPRRGLGANRNHCLEITTGEVVAFIDDDVTVDSQFVEVATSLGRPRTIVTGWELNHSFDPPRKVSAHNASFLGFQRLEPRGKLNAICINATVFPRELFELIEFDELIHYGYEEIDIARHATSLGWEIVFNDDLHVQHFPSASNRDSYAAALNVSRLYLTHRSYLAYENNRVKAAAFNVVGATHHMLYSLKNGHGIKKAAETIRTARKMQLSRSHEDG